MKDVKWGNYGLYTALTSAALLAVQSVGDLFGFKLTPDQFDGIMTAVNSVLGVLVVLGVVSNPSKGKGFSDKNGSKGAK